MLYRVVRVINEWYAISVFWAYLGLFLVAFALVFVFPLGPILLLFLGLAGLGVAIIAGKLLRQMQLSLARHALAQGRCPRCQFAMPQHHPLQESWTCIHCGSQFGIRGDEATPIEQYE
jgi:hypothetical protein